MANSNISLNVPICRTHSLLLGRCGRRSKASKEADQFLLDVRPWTVDRHRVQDLVQQLQCPGIDSESTGLLVYNRTAQYFTPNQNGRSASSVQIYIWFVVSFWWVSFLKVLSGYVHVRIAAKSRIAFESLMTIFSQKFKSYIMVPSSCLYETHIEPINRKKHTYSQSRLSI